MIPGAYHIMTDLKKAELLSPASKPEDLISSCYFFNVLR